MKRFLSVILGCLFLFFTGCTAKTTEERIEEYNGYYYIDWYGGRYIVGVKSESLSNGELMIPEIIGSKPIVGIGCPDTTLISSGTVYPFQSNDLVERIVVPKNVKINENALWQLNNLHSLIIDEKSSNFKEQQLTNLQDLKISFNGVNASGANSLVRDSKDFRALSIQCEKFDNFASKDSSRLIFLEINGVKSIETSFERFSSLSVIVFPETVETLKENAFNDNTDIDIYIRKPKNEMLQIMEKAGATASNIYYDFNQYVIVFDSNGGSKITFSETKKNYILADSGEMLILPENPIREGKNFAGWYLDYAFCHKWDFEKDTINKNLFLIAKWE